MGGVVQDGDQSSGVDQTGLLDASSSDEPRTVLRVVIENMLYSVSLDTLYQVVHDHRSYPTALYTHRTVSYSVSKLLPRLPLILRSPSRSLQYLKWGR